MHAKLPMIRFLLLVCALCLPATTMARDLPDFREIARDNSPAVVKIIVEQRASRAGGGQPGLEELPDYLRRFFEHRGAPRSERPRMGMGSGFIISRDGYIVTNNHVVEGADSVQVRLDDRREFEAEVIGTDPRSDIALLRIHARDLPVVRLGTSADLEVGEWVLAIGSPFGLDYSVTAGIVSAKGRSLPTERNENYVPFIQTDVAINPGNSGGPLINLDGEVVGVNSQIFTRSGGSIGLSFAIPVHVVRNVVEQLKRDGRVTRGWLGVTIQNVDKNLADSFGLDRPRGALVSKVMEGSPAEDAGLESGDVIVAFAGHDIDTSADLPHVVGLLAPDTEVDMKVVRDRKTRRMRVTVGGLDADDSYSLASAGQGADRGGRLGLVVEEVPPANLERVGISGGVLVREVVSGSAGAEAGLISGDILTLIGTTPIDSVSAYERAVDDLKAGVSVPVRLIRRGSPMFIGLKLAE